MNNNRLLILAGAFFLIFGGLLPWISMPDLFDTRGAAYEGIEAGRDGDELLTAGAGLRLLFGKRLYGRKAGQRLILEGTALTVFGLPVIFFSFQ